MTNHLRLGKERSLVIDYIIDGVSSRKQHRAIILCQRLAGPSQVLLSQLPQRRHQPPAAVTILPVVHLSRELRQWNPVGVVSVAIVRVLFGRTQSSRLAVVGINDARHLNLVVGKILVGHVLLATRLLPPVSKRVQTYTIT